MTLFVWWTTLFVWWTTFLCSLYSIRHATINVMVLVNDNSMLGDVMCILVGTESKRYCTVQYKYLYNIIKSVGYDCVKSIQLKG